MLIPLDGSKVAQQALPYARTFARGLKIPVELLGVVDVDALEALADSARGRDLRTLATERMQAASNYLEAIARSFEGAAVKCSVEKGKPEEVVIEKAATDKNTLILMATHGRSGVQRWLLGSVAEKILRGASNHVLLVRVTEGGKTDGEAVLKTVVVPLDGSKLAEKALRYVVDIAKKMRLEVILTQAYALPMSVYYGPQDYLPGYEEVIAELKEETCAYLEEKVNELKQKGLDKVSFVSPEGFGANKIVELACQIPDNFIAMCTHGRSGIRRWALGSVTEKVVRLSGDPVLVIRAA
jgi:nucleotide-binding universal stress UspA family protein